MDHLEARLKIAELASSMVEAHAKVAPDKCKYASDLEKAFHVYYDAIYKDIVRTAPKKDVVKKTPPPAVKA